MARTKKAKMDEVMQLEEFYELTSEHKEKVVEMLNSGGIVDIHKSADKIKWRDYLYSIFKERLYTREVDQNDIIKSLRGEAIGNEIFRIIDVEKVDYETFVKVMKTRANEEGTSAKLGYIVLKGNRKCDKDREIDSRTYMVDSNLILYNKKGKKISIIARDGQSVIQVNDIKEYVKKEEIDFCYFLGTDNIVINEELFKEELDNAVEDIIETDGAVEEEGNVNLSEIENSNESEMKDY